MTKASVEMMAEILAQDLGKTEAGESLDTSARSVPQHRPQPPNLTA